MSHTFVAGVDLGASNVRVAIAEPNGEISARRSMSYAGGTPEDALAQIGRTIDDLVRGVWPGSQVAAIGVALPGSVDPERGVVATPANLPGWGEVPLAEILGGTRGVPVAMDNDANAAAVGELWLGAARGLRDFVFVALGTGIGTGIVLGGQVHRGAHFLAGEVAFSPMSREQLRECGWDNCLETLVGGRAHAARAVELFGEGAPAARLFDAARDGHEAAAAWVRASQEHLAMAVVQMVSLLDPHAIVFGGGVATAQGEAYLAPVREMALRCTPATPKIVLSELGEQAQMMGAIRLALDKLEAGGR